MMVQMMMSAVGYHSGNVRVAQQVNSPMLFRKLVGFAIISSGYVAIVASLVHAISG